MKDAFTPLERDTINLPDPKASKCKPIKSTPKPLERNSEYPLVPETPEWRHGASTVGKTTRCNFWWKLRIVKAKPCSDSLSSNNKVCRY